DKEGAARVDLMHQVEALHIRFQRAGELYGAGIVDADVYAAEGFDRGRHCLGHLILVADIAENRQRPSAGRLDLARGSIDRARQLRMRLGGLGGNGHIGTVPRRADGDGKTDTPATAGDEKRLSLERHMTGPSLRNL